MNRRWQSNASDPINSVKWNPKFTQNLNLPKTDRLHTKEFDWILKLTRYEFRFYLQIRLFQTLCLSFDKFDGHFWYNIGLYRKARSIICEFGNAPYCSKIQTFLKPTQTYPQTSFLITDYITITMVKNSDNWSVLQEKELKVTRFKQSHWLPGVHTLDLKFKSILQIWFQSSNG